MNKGFLCIQFTKNLFPGALRKTKSTMRREFYGSYYPPSVLKVGTRRVMGPIVVWNDEL